VRFASKKGGSRVPTRDLNANAFFSSGSLRQISEGLIFVHDGRTDGQTDGQEFQAK